MHVERFGCNSIGYRSVFLMPCSLYDPAVCGLPNWTLDTRVVGNRNLLLMGMPVRATPGCECKSGEYQKNKKTLFVSATLACCKDVFRPLKIIVDTAALPFKRGN